MTSDSTPETPRQREILRRLRLVGGAPASYFADACRLMAQEPPLESQTHLVAHLLRELNSGLLGALEPMVRPEDWPEKGTADRQAKMIDAVCDALRVPADDPLRRSWKAFSRRPAELAHRRGLVAPRPVDREFEDYWELGEAVFHAVTERIEANYAENLPRIERLAKGPPDIGAYRDTMLHSTVALDRFYALAGVEWLGPLRGDGAFSHPPPLVANEEGLYAYPRWPPGRFLARVAADAPEEVIEIGRNLETNNPEAQESLTEAALQMEVSDAVALVEQIGQWLENPVHWRLPSKARDLVVRFVAAGAVEEGLALFRPLVTGARGVEAVDGEEVLWLVERIFPAVGLAGLDLLVDLVAEQAGAEGGRSLKYSQSWRPDIRSERMRNDRDHLVSGVRDAARSLVEADTDVGEVVTALERPGVEITRRIAIDLLAQHAMTDVAKSHLLDRELLEDGTCRREYTMLAEAGFGHLDVADQAQLLEWIDEPRQHAEHPKRQRFWQLHMLSALGDQLPEERIARREELEGEFGPVDPKAVAITQARFVGSRSPLTSEDMQGMGTDALLDYLRTWKPEDGFDAPSPEGLAAVLEGVVKDEPAAFAIAAPNFVDVDPTYIRRLLRGLEVALEAGRDFDWRPVLDLIAAIGERPGDAGRQDQVPADADPGWSWSWQQALQLILHGLDSEAGNKIDPDLFDTVSEIARDYVKRPDPSLTDEREASREPESVALNSVRCTAMRVVIALAARKREADESGEGGLDSDTVTLLEERLDPEQEPSRAVRSIFGWRFGTLMFCDEAWARARVPAIFLIEDDGLWRAAWESFVMRHRAHEKLLEVLEADYRRAIEAISIEKSEERLNDPDEALVAHLVSYYISGSIDFGADSLLTQFYERASIERRSQAISILGTSMEALSPLGEEGEARLKALVERRLTAVEGGAGADELAGFAWWFSSGEFDTNWSLDFLRRALEAGCQPHPDHVIAERLAQLAGENVIERIEILRLMVERAARDWFVVGSRERIEAILREGFVSGGQAMSKARDLVNVLVARGNLDFADLLGGNQGEAQG